MMPQMELETAMSSEAEAAPARHTLPAERDGQNVSEASRYVRLSLLGTSFVSAPMCLFFATSLIDVFVRV